MMVKDNIVAFLSPDAIRVYDLKNYNAWSWKVDKQQNAYILDAVMVYTLSNTINLTVVLSSNQQQSNAPFITFQSILINSDIFSQNVGQTYTKGLVNQFSDWIGQDFVINSQIDMVDNSNDLSFCIQKMNYFNSEATSLLGYL